MPGFLDLPIELRLQVYEYAMTPGNLLTFRVLLPPFPWSRSWYLRRHALRAVCRQTREEMENEEARLLIKVSSFRFSAGAYLQRISKRDLYRVSLRSIQIDFIDYRVPHREVETYGTVKHWLQALSRFPNLRHVNLSLGQHNQLPGAEQEDSPFFQFFYTGTDLAAHKAEYKNAIKLLGLEIRCWIPVVPERAGVARRVYGPTWSAVLNLRAHGVLRYRCVDAAGWEELSVEKSVETLESESDCAAGRACGDALS